MLRAIAQVPYIGSLLNASIPTQIPLVGAAAGLVGGSIEDATGRADEPIYPFDLAVERVKAAAAAARRRPQAPRR